MTKIIINPIGGLANRMRCIASGIALAMETGSDYEVVWAVNDELAAYVTRLYRCEVMILLMETGSFSNIPCSYRT